MLNYVNPLWRLKNWQTYRQVVRSRLVSSRAKELYFLIASYIGDTGESFPSQQALADDMGVTRKTVINLTSELEKSGLIEKILPAGKAKLAHCTSRYKFVPNDVFCPKLEISETGNNLEISRSNLELPSGDLPIENLEAIQEIAGNIIDLVVSKIQTGEISSNDPSSRRNLSILSEVTSALLPIVVRKEEKIYKKSSKPRKALTPPPAPEPPSEDTLWICDLFKERIEHHIDLTWKAKKKDLQVVTQNYHAIKSRLIDLNRMLKYYSWSVSFDDLSDLLRDFFDWYVNSKEHAPHPNLFHCLDIERFNDLLKPYLTARYNSEWADMLLNTKTVDELYIRDRDRATQKYQDRLDYIQELLAMYKHDPERLKFWKEQYQDSIACFKREMCGDILAAIDKKDWLSAWEEPTYATI